MFRKVKKRLIMLMLAMCLAMSPAYSFMMVQDPLAIVTTINNFVQTVTFYKNQIQKTYDEYKRIAKAVQSIKLDDWRTWAQAAADLSNQINNWDIAGTTVDLVLESIEAGGTGALDIVDGWDNIKKAWEVFGDSVNQMKNADFSNFWKNPDEGFSSIMSGLDTFDRAVTITGRGLNTAVNAIADTYNPIAELSQAWYDKLQETIDNLYEQKTKQEKVLEEQKEKKKKLEEEYKSLLDEISSASASQQDTVVQQKTTQKEKKLKEIDKIEEQIAKTEKRLEKTKDQITEKEQKLANEADKARKNVLDFNGFLKDTHMIFGKKELASMLEGWRDDRYVSTYGRN